jgi:hypothetical protein
MNNIEYIKRDFKQEINKLYGDRLSQIILYGSLMPEEIILKTLI